MSMIRLSVMCVVAVFLSGCEPKRKNIEYVLPAGFKGWAIVIYDLKKEDQLVEVDEKTLRVVITDSGIVPTSSSLQTGEGYDSFWKLEDDGSISKASAAEFGGVSRFHSGNIFTQDIGAPVDYFAFFVGRDGGEKRDPTEIIEEFFKVDGARVPAKSPLSEAGE